MADIKQCKNCAYWTGVTGSNGTNMHFCHHILHTGKRRVEVDGVCQSWMLRTKNAKHIEHDYYEGDEEV